MISSSLRPKACRSRPAPDQPGRYRRDGTTTSLLLDLPITTNGTGAGAVTATLPLAASGVITSVTGGREFDASGKALTGQITGSSVGIRFYDNTYLGADGVRIRLNGYYETA